MFVLCFTQKILDFSLTALIGVFIFTWMQKQFPFDENGTTFIALDIEGT